MIRAVVLLLLFTVLGRTQALASTDRDAIKGVYDHLLPQIERILIFDNHAHPGYADDPNVDAMASPPGSTPFRLRADNPELVAAAKALFGYPYADFAPAHAKWLVEKKQALKKTGPAYFDGILDRLGIEASAANRVDMPEYLDPKRFWWVCFVDSFLFPLDNRAIIARNGDERVYLPLQEKLLKSELKAAGLSAPPDSLDDYVSFIDRTLNENKRKGAIAIKFEAAYFRSLHFGDPTKAQAAAVYKKYRAGGVPSLGDYTLFQDYVFRRILDEAGRLHMPVQFHTSVGTGDYFSFHNGNVLNLENILRDPRYDGITFVLLHGGYPFDRAAIWLAMRRNVYIDTSLMELWLYPHEFARVLREWLEILPDKVIYGSDAFPFNDAVGAEESYWLAVKSAREALATALAEMVASKEISEDEALRLARNYLHDTAVKLYKR